MCKLKTLFISSFLLIIYLLIMLLPGCALLPRSSKEGSPKEATIAPITIAYQEDSLLHLPLYVALQNNFFQEEGLLVQLQKYASPQEAVESVIAGKYDLLLSGPELGFFLYQQGQPSKLVYLAQSTMKNGWFLLARETASSPQKQPAGKRPSDTQPPSNQPIEQNELLNKSTPPFDWSSVKGRVVLGAGNGEFAQIMLESILKQQQIRPYLDVHLLINLPSYLRQGTFQSGTAHFFLATEPAATILEKGESGQVVTSLSKDTEPLISSVIYAAKEKIPQKRDSYQKFMNAFSQALRWVNEHSPEELATVGKAFFPQQDEKTLIRGICRYKNLGCWSESPLLEKKELIKLHDFLLNAGELNSALPAAALDELTEPSFAQKALRSH